MSAQILIVDDGFELRFGRDSAGPLRLLDAAAVSTLEDLAVRYRLLVRTPNATAGLIAVGRDLSAWLDGESGAWTELLRSAPRPLLLEVRGPLEPTPAEWAMLRAPWGLLADRDGHLARNSILGFAPLRRLGELRQAPALDDYRLGAAFMAAAPRGQKGLDFEAEEAAILDAVGDRGLDLIVDESGDPDQLAERLVAAGGMPLVHISAHGQNDWRPPGEPEARPRPVLLLEGDGGEPKPTNAAGLVQALRPAPPRLLFLSACLSATPSGDAADGVNLAVDGGAEIGLAGGGEAPDQSLAHSLASLLIRAGTPAVLGWDGSVADRAASAFAARLYAELGQRLEPAHAVAGARRALLDADDPVLAGDWHLARLWLGPDGGGPLVGGKRKRSLLPATHGQKELLGKRVRVASHEMFVGRRRQLQQALAVLRRGEHAGVLLHGMGRLGKSSLAARIVNRTRDHYALAVVYDRYGVRDLLEAISEALRHHPAARALLREGMDRLHRNPAHDHEGLTDLLTDLLEGPCAQVDGQAPPLLLVIDDMEQILDTGAGPPPFPVKPALAPVLRAVLRAFDPDRSDSRLLLTSRFPFHLDGLQDGLLAIQLPPFTETSQRKLQRRQQDAARQDGALTDNEERQALLPRVAETARGNPGLQDLIGRGLVLSSDVPIDRARALLDRMDGWLSGGGLPDEPEIRAFLEGLAVETLLDLAGDAGRALLRSLTLLDLPIPEPRVRELALALGGNPDALRGLGLLDPFEDRVDHRVTALAVNALVRPRLAALTDAESIAVAGLILPGLYAAWGGAEGSKRWPVVCDLTLTRLALAADDAAVTALCAANAVQALEAGPAEEGAALGRDAVALLDRHQYRLPWMLLSRAARAAVTAGHGKAADRLIERGAAALEAARAAGEDLEPMDAAHLLVEQARRLKTRGEQVGAERLFDEASALAGAAGSDVSVAVIRGEVADILASRGELDEALRIRREEELPVYERLGEVRALLVGRANLAMGLLRGVGGREEANSLLCLALVDARRLGLPEAGQIEQILEQAGMICP